MKSLNTFSDQVGSLPTETVKALAHSFGLDLLRCRERNIASVPTIALVRNPSSFTTSGSDPDTGLTSSVDYGQRPFGLQFLDIAVRDLDSAQRIDNFDRIVFENHLWLDPEEIDQSAENHCDEQFRDGLASILQDKERIRGEERDQNEGNTSQNEVASGSEGFIHLLSIAGERR